MSASATKKQMFKRPVVKQSQPTVDATQIVVNEQARKDAILDKANSKLAALATSLAKLKRQPEDILMDMDVDGD